MEAKTHGTAQLGELIAAAFDEAARYSDDPRDVASMATHAVQHMLRRATRIPAIGARLLRYRRARPQPARAAVH